MSTATSILQMLLRVILGLTVFLSLSHRAFAQWSTDPSVNTPVCVAPGEQKNVVIASDGSGGTYFVWEDFRSGSNSNIYAQRLNSAGIAQWTGNGISLCQQIESQTSPRVISDGSGGAIVGWIDQRSGGAAIYCQRLNPTGKKLWSPEGVLIAEVLNSTIELSAASDNAGGVIFSWEDHRNDTSAAHSRPSVYAQRIRRGGQRAWASGGLPTTYPGAVQRFHTMVSDGRGGANLCWSSDSSVIAQRINSAGVMLWGSGKLVANAGASPLLTSDGEGGAAVTWRPLSGPWAISCSRLDASGNAAWEQQPVLVDSVLHNGPVQLVSERLITDGEKGVYVSYFFSYFRGTSVYVKHIDRTGTQVTSLHPLWANGYEVSMNSALANDGEGGVFVAATARPMFIASPPRIYVQHYDKFGNTQWFSGGIAVSVNLTNWPGSVMIANPFPDGPVLAWADLRSGEPDIYARKVQQGSVMTSFLGVTNSDYNGRRIDLAVDLFKNDVLIGTDTLANQVITGNGLANSKQLEIPLSVTDVNFGPTDILKAKVSIRKSGGSGDFGVRFWYNADSVKNSSKGWSRLSTLGGSSSYYYFRNGNVLGTTAGLSEMAATLTANNTFQSFGSWEIQGSLLKGGSGEEAVADLVPKEFELSQNYPNPFNPSTTIRYVLPKSSVVTLNVYNALGQHVAQLVNEEQQAGDHEVVFRADGLASGVYFYRLQAGDNLASKKLLLLR